MSLYFLFSYIEQENFEIIYFYLLQFQYLIPHVKLIFQLQLVQFPSYAIYNSKKKLWLKEHKEENKVLFCNLNFIQDQMFVHYRSQHVQMLSNEMLTYKINKLLLNLFRAILR